MADIVRGTNYPVLKLNKGAEVTAASKSAAFTVEATGGDYKLLCLMANSSGSSATVTFAKGNGIQGVGADLVVTIANSKTFAIVLDSGYFKNVSGTDKDCIKITPSAAIGFTFVELPQ